MVLGDGGPSICKDFNVTFPEVQHRFDGKDHAFLEGDAGPWFSIVEDLRILMKFLSDAMATEFADDRKSMLFGVLLIIAPTEHKARIEVGYGLEPILTDALSSLILQNTVLPKFRSGDFNGGVNAGVDALIQQLSLSTSDAEAKAAAAQQQAGQDNGPGQPGGISGLVIFLFIAFAIFRVFGGWGFLPFLFMGGGRGGFGGGGFGGGGGGGFGGGGGGSFGGGGSSGSW